MEYINKLENNIIFDLLENKTYISKKVWTYGILSMTLYIIMGMSLVSNLIGFVYPAYMSYKSLKTQKREDDEQWLIYWIVYSLLIFMEMFVNIIFSWIPFYYHIKLCFLLWLSYEKTQGAKIIYIKYIEPYLIENETKVDEILKTTQDLVNDVEEMKEEMNEEMKEEMKEEMISYSKTNEEKID